jgi:uncharacterized protein YkwD
LLALAVAVAAGGAIKVKSGIADEIADLLQEHRRQAGVAKLERRPVLDAAAGSRARELARRAPELRLSEEEPMDALLRDAGVLRYQRVQEHVELQQGYADAPGVAVRRWREAPNTWSIMMDPSMDALGVSTVVGDDGWLVLVVVFLEDLEVPAELAAWEAQLLEAVNRIRAENGLPVQRASAPLAQVARLHSEDMARREFFAHTTPEGYDLSRRIQGRDLPFLRLAENIGRNRGHDDPVAEAVRGWMDSSAHRRNILDRDLIETGIGIAMDEHGTFYFTQVFLQPRRPRTTD